MWRESRHNRRINIGWGSNQGNPDGSRKTQSVSSVIKVWQKCRVTAAMKLMWFVASDKVVWCETRGCQLVSFIWSAGKARLVDWIGMLTCLWAKISLLFTTKVAIPTIISNRQSKTNRSVFDRALVNHVRSASLSNCANRVACSTFAFHRIYFFLVCFRCRVCARGLGEFCLSGKAEQEKLERAAATQNMDRAFTWPCALWVRQVAASSTGPPTWASHCCYCRRRHRSVCCRWEACRHRTTLTSLPTLGWVHPRAVGTCWHQCWATG